MPLSTDSFSRLVNALDDVAATLSDDQVLDLADRLHDELRRRRSLRSHHRDRMERRLPESPHWPEPN